MTRHDGVAKSFLPELTALNVGYGPPAGMGGEPEIAEISANAEEVTD